MVRAGHGRSERLRGAEAGFAAGGWGIPIGDVIADQRRRGHRSRGSGLRPDMRWQTGAAVGRNPDQESVSCPLSGARSRLAMIRLPPVGGRSSVALRRKSSKKTSSKTSKSEDATTSAERTAIKTGSKSAALVATLSDPKTLRRLLLAAKVVGPVVAATAMKTSTGVRGALDERRAAKLGVPVEDVAEYKGPTGTVNARITGLQKSVAELRTRRGSDQKVSRLRRHHHRPAERVVGRGHCDPVDAGRHPALCGAGYLRRPRPARCRADDLPGRPPL